jgi:hypothetical protein
MNNKEKERMKGVLKATLMIQDLVKETLEANDADTIESTLSLLQSIGYNCTSGVKTIKWKFPAETTDFYRKLRDIPLFYSSNPAQQADNLDFVKEVQLGEGLALQPAKRSTGGEAYTAIETLHFQLDCIRTSKLDLHRDFVPDVGGDQLAVIEAIEGLPELTKETYKEWVPVLVDCLMLYRKMREDQIMAHFLFHDCYRVLLLASASIGSAKFKELQAKKQEAFVEKWKKKRDKEDFIIETKFEVELKQLCSLDLTAECNKYALRKYLSGKLKAWLVDG